MSKLQKSVTSSTVNTQAPQSVYLGHQLGTLRHAASAAVCATYNMHLGFALLSLKPFENMVPTTWYFTPELFSAYVIKKMIYEVSKPLRPHNI